jgi:hypothetical protein
MTNHERRVEPRVALQSPVYVDYSNRCYPVHDISLSGAFIDDPRPLPPGTWLELKLWLSQCEPFVVTAIVRRVEEGSGMGVELLLNETDYNRLHEYLHATTLTA